MRVGARRPVRRFFRIIKIEMSNRHARLLLINLCMKTIHFLYASHFGPLLKFYIQQCAAAHVPWSSECHGDEGLCVSTCAGELEEVTAKSLRRRIYKMM